MDFKAAMQYLFELLYPKIPLIISVLMASCVTWLLNLNLKWYEVLPKIFIGLCLSYITYRGLIAIGRPNYSPALPSLAAMIGQSFIAAIIKQAPSITKSFLVKKSKKEETED